MKQYDIFIVSLDPTIGSEIRKTRPCIVISPDEMNGPLNTVQVAPMTSSLHAYPWRASISFKGKRGKIALDQIRTVDKKRLVKPIGRASQPVVRNVKRIIYEMLVQ